MLSVGLVPHMDTHDTTLDADLGLERPVDREIHKLNNLIIEANDTLKRIRGARIALGLIGVLTIVVAVINTRSGLLDYASGVGAGVEGVVYLVCAALAPRFPRACLGIGLGLYALGIAILAFTDAALILEGITLRAAIVAFLTLGLLAAIRLVRLRGSLRERGMTHAELLPLDRLQRLPRLRKQAE